MFRRGDGPVASGTARLTIPTGQVEPLTADNVSLPEAWKHAGLATRDTLSHRLELRFTPGGTMAAKRSEAAASPVAWDAAAGLYTVDAPATMAVVGRCPGKSITLAGARFDVQANPRNFAVLTLTAADGNVETTAMGWNADHSSVGRQWGQAPTLCEGISAKITLTTGAQAAKVHVLDGTGARTGEVPAALQHGQLTFDIGPRFKTLWYEIVVE